MSQIRQRLYRYGENLDLLVNVLFGAIATEPRSRDFEFLGSITKGHEAQNPQENANSFRADIFDGTDVNGLAVITKPVSKVDLSSH